MSQASIRSQPGANSAGQTIGPAHPDAANQTIGKVDQAKPGDDASRYGKEGTNKTQPQPKPDYAPSDEPGGNTPHIPRSPYTRG